MFTRGATSCRAVAIDERRQAPDVTVTTANYEKRKSGNQEQRINDPQDKKSTSLLPWPFPIRPGHETWFDQ
jgi:hypothetical protein